MDEGGPTNGGAKPITEQREVKERRPGLGREEQGTVCIGGDRSCEHSKLI